MPRVIRKNTLTFGHSPTCFPPTLPTPLKEDVHANGSPVVRVGDPFLPHGCVDLASHPPIAIIGSPTVFVGGQPIVRDFDPLSCGDIAHAIDGTVFSDGGGGFGALREPDDPLQSFGFVVEPPSISYSNPNIRIGVIYTRNNGGLIRVEFTEVSPIRPSEAYTKLTSEQTQEQFFNRPGSPITSQAGASIPGQGIPRIFTDPIPISNFRVRKPGGGDQTLWPGIFVDSLTGEIYGTPTSQPNWNSGGTAIVDVYVEASNYTGYPQGNFGSADKIRLNFSLFDEPNQ